MDVQLTATLDTLGQTVAGGPDGSSEPWARLIVEDAEQLEAFSALPRPEGQDWAVMTGNFGGGFSVEVNDRQVHIDSIGKISVNFDRSGRAIKATLHNILWSESA